MTPNFHPFVLPFCIGTLLLFSILFVKFYRWIDRLDRKQKKIIQKHFFRRILFATIWEMIREGLFHVKVTKHSLRLGYMHRSIALGWFLLIVVGFVEVLVHSDSVFHAPWMGIFYRYFVRVPAVGESSVFAHIMDALLVYVLSGVSIAFVKSIYSRIAGMRKTTKLKFFDVVLRYSLWGIFPLRLLSESCTAALTGNGGFLTNALGECLGESFSSTMELTFWSLYSFDLAIFFSLMPFSRYMHIFAELVLIFLRKYGVVESEKESGYTRLELSACSRCGICIDGCPIDSELKITDIQPVYFLRNQRNGVSNPSAVENCLMCNRCTVDCPVGIEITQIRRQARDKGDLDTRDNYHYIDSINSFNAIGRVVYFGGCMSHLTPGITESMKKIFDAAGQKYWMMDEDRTICCGRPLLQQGFHTQAAELRRKNTNLIIESRSKQLVTSCPICYQSFTKEYNLPVKVMHHTEYISMLIRLGRLKLKPSDLRVAYHDPCELGRGCGIYDEPREVLSTVAHLVPAAKEREESICCGYNLGDTALSLEQQMTIRNASWRNLTFNHPDVVATACPMCKKAFVHAKTHDVRDIAEIVAAALK